MNNLIIVAGILFCSLFHDVRAFSDCGSTDGAIINVEIPGCDNIKRCVLKRNSNATVQLEFKTNVDSAELKAVVHGVVLGVPIPFELPNPDGCTDSDVTCPIKSGETYKYKATLPVLEEYPKVSVDVKWELQDSSNRDVICVLIPVTIK